MIVRETREDIELLRIEHGKVNAIDVELLDGLSAELAALAAEPPRGLVLTGAGRNFSAGLDLVRLLAEGNDYLARLLPALDQALKALYSFPRPVIAAVNGHAIAGGFVIACACDARIVAAGGAKLGITELPVGVPFPAAPLEMVRAALGTGSARELAYSGRLFSANQAVEVGFATELAPDNELLDRACVLASHWGRAPAGAFELTKRQIQHPVLERLATHGPAFDAEIAKIWADPATRAAIQGFIDRTLGK